MGPIPNEARVSADAGGYMYIHDPELVGPPWLQKTVPSTAVPELLT